MRQFKAGEHIYQEDLDEGALYALSNGDVVRYQRGYSFAEKAKRWFIFGKASKTLGSVPASISHMWDAGDDAPRTEWVLYSPEGVSLVPEIRTSGTVKRKDVRMGEAFTYSDKQKHGSYRYFMTEGGGSVPADWSVSNLTSFSTLHADDTVTLIPRWDAVEPVLRTSGEMLRKDVRVGEAYFELSNPDRKVILIDKGEQRPSDLPKDWGYNSHPAHSDVADIRVKLIPHYRTAPAKVESSTEIRTSGEVLRKDVRPGESYLIRNESTYDKGKRVYVPRQGEQYPYHAGRSLPDGWLHNPGNIMTNANEYVTLVPRWDSQVPLVRTELVGMVDYKHGNSGRTYTFEAGTNSYTKEKGWKPLDLAGSGQNPGFDPVSSVMAVHDLMEHFPGDEYAPHNEYMAQGAMLWLRYEGGFFDGQDLATAVVKPAFGMLYHHVVKGKLETKEFTPSAESTGNPFTHMERTTAFALFELVTATKKHAENQYTGSNRGAVLDSLGRGVPWMVHGYLRASQRYAGLDKKRLVRLYKNTVAQIANVADGGRLKLTMRYEQYSADVELVTTLKVA